MSVAGLQELNSTYQLLEELGRAEIADRALANYIAAHKTEKEAFDAGGYRFRSSGRAKLGRRSIRNCSGSRLTSRFNRLLTTSTSTLVGEQRREDCCRGKSERTGAASSFFYG
jgi:hypothetical protein